MSTSVETLIHAAAENAALAVHREWQEKWGELQATVRRQQAVIDAVAALADQIEDESMYGEKGVTRRENAAAIRTALAGQEQT